MNIVGGNGRTINHSHAISSQGLLQAIYTWKHVEVHIGANLGLRQDHY
jgi:hypothetical protein